MKTFKFSSDSHRKIAKIPFVQILVLKCFCCFSLWVSKRVTKVSSSIPVNTEVYAEPCQISKMELFTKTVNV